MTTRTKAAKHGPVYAKPAYTVRVRGEHGCSVVSSADSIRAQIEAYLFSRPDGIVDVYYSEYCAKCSGSGRVRGRRIMQWLPCPACSGDEPCGEQLLVTECRNERTAG